MSKEREIAITEEPRVAFYDFKKKIRHIKESRLVMYPTGRWGSRWLHKLVFRMAMNLGMLGHDRSLVEIRESFIKYPIGRGLPETIDKALLQYLRETRYKPNELEILMGQDQIVELKFAVLKEMTWSAPINIAENVDGVVTRWRDIDVRLVPFLAGFVIAPKRTAR